MQQFVQHQMNRAEIIQFVEALSNQYLKQGFDKTTSRQRALIELAQQLKDDPEVASEVWFQQKLSGE